jgi:hypothetical protein
VGGHTAGRPGVKAEKIAHRHLGFVVGLVFGVALLLRVEVENQPVVDLVADALVADGARMVFAADKPRLLQKVDVRQHRRLGQIQLRGNGLHVHVPVGQKRQDFQPNVV